MPSYRVHRLRNHLRPSFLSAPHVSGQATVKPRDYEAAGSIEASSPYGAFFSAKEGDAPLAPGDLLEAEDGSLRIYKYVGFEEARWFIAETPVGETAAESTCEDQAKTAVG